MEALLIRYSGKGDNKMATVTFKKECTIYNINDLYQSILESVNVKAVSKIVIKEMSNIDLSGIQLIIALKKSIKEHNKDLKIDIALEKTHELVINNCGLNDLIRN